MSGKVNKEWSVYCHTNKINNKKYIGITSMDFSLRWGKNGYGYRTQNFYRAIKKYGWNNFTHEILFEGLSEKKAKTKEIELICKYNTKIPNGYNITEGGDGSVGYKATLKTRKKLSESHIGQRPWNKGIKAYPETIKKLKQAHKLLWKNEEHQEKMSKAHIGFTHTEETKYKISKNSARKRKVIQIETSKGEIVREWDTIKEATDEGFDSSSAISNCCAERTLTYKSYIWMYLEDYSPSNIKRRLGLVGKRRVKK